MNNKIKSIVLPVATLIVGAGIAGGVAVHAASTDGSQTNPMSNLVTAIAQKFNLNVSDVQQVFDDQHQQMQQQHQQMIADRLKQAVSDGKLTQEQADKITAKFQELQTQREANKDNFKNLTEAERKAQMDKFQSELKQWAQDNNIPQEFLPFALGGPKGHHGMAKMGEMGGMRDINDMSNPQQNQ